MVIVKKFIAAAKSKVVPTLERQLEQAVKTDNVGQFVRLVQENAHDDVHQTVIRPEIKAMINDVLHDAIDQGKILTFTRIYMALSISSCASIIRPSLVCYAINHWKGLPEKHPVELAEKRFIIEEISGSASYYNDPRHKSVAGMTYRSNTGREIPSRVFCPAPI